MSACAKPALYTIPAGEPFLQVLAEAIINENFPGGIKRAQNSDFSDYTILVPTRRAAKALRDAFWQVLDHQPMLLPAIRPLGDIDEDEIAFGTDGFETNIDIKPAISSLERQMLLARFILDWAQNSQQVLFDEEIKPAQLVATPAQAVALAAELGALIDNADIEEIDLGTISTIIADNFAENWQLTLNFLTILFKTLPDELEGRQLIGPMKRRSLLMRAEADRLAREQPTGPIIAAGSTGSVPATAHLLKIIANLPNGAVVLPGLDTYLDQPAWDNLSEAHPQFGLRQLLVHIGAERKDVVTLPKTPADDEISIRSKLFSEVMRPAETTENWAEIVQKFDLEATKKALASVTLIETDNAREEAQAIALVLRELADEPKTIAALVTPDRMLAARVKSELERWDINIDDSAGVHLDRSVPGTFLILLARAVSAKFAPIAFASLLKHPLMRAGFSRAQLLGFARTIELASLRGSRPADGLTGIKQALASTKKQQGKNRYLHQTIAQIDEQQWSQIFVFIDRLAEIVEPLVTLAEADKPSALIDVLHIHVEIAGALSMGAEPEDTDNTGQVINLWQSDAGSDLAGFCTNLFEAASVFGNLNFIDYPFVLEAFLRNGMTRPRSTKHPRLHIWGLLEARLLQADVMILGGLNENIWPGTANIDPWVNRPMRTELGLQPPERRIGLSAHDFVQAASAKQVFLTRAEKNDGAPAIASRWLLKLKALLAGIGSNTLLQGDKPWLGWTRALNEPQIQEPISPPRPCPPLAARPRKLSVTEIETWIRDPYALYARKILKLSPLEPLDADPSASERGSIIHEIFQRFSEISDEPFDNTQALQKLLNLGRQVFNDHMDRPGVAGFWWPRFERMAEWFIAQEQILRQTTTKQLCEVRGTYSVEAPQGAFELTARADRIDVLTSGNLRLLDYKTGQVPSVDQVTANFSPQLPLEVIIAQAGGFEGLSKAQVEAFGYIKLSGAEPAGEIKMVAPTQENAGELADLALAGLIARIKQFDDEKTPYLPSIARDFETQIRDFDHLARYREWSVNPGKDGSK